MPQRAEAPGGREGGAGSGAAGSVDCVEGATPAARDVPRRLPPGAVRRGTAEWLDRPFPTHVSYVSVYPRSDWVVDWHACVDPDADNVEIDSSHVGMSVHPQVCRLLGDRLAVLAGRTASRPGEPVSGRSG
jgi:hypothetical protein